MEVDISPRWREGVASLALGGEDSGACSSPETGSGALAGKMRMMKDRRVKRAG